MIAVTLDQVWPAGPILPPLQDNDVHVWSASLDVSPAYLSELRKILSEDERNKETHFHFQRDKDRYVASKGALRAILARYVGMPPAALRFVRNPHGKPALAARNRLTSAAELGTALCFNMSHSQNLALYAITFGREVGIDVECMRTGFAALTDGEGMQIAEQFFSSYEVAMLRQLPDALRQRGFFHTWTRKEAYLKARGDGLSVPLNEFDVSVRPDEPPVLLRAQQDPREVGRWSLRALEPAPGFVGTVVVQGPVDAWQLWRWPAW
jgi:4'-phosphopantetheinyl transferase